MKCDICGNEFDDNLNVCSFCGASAKKNAQQTGYNPSNVADPNGFIVNNAQYEDMRKQKNAENFAIASFALSLSVTSILGIVFGCLGPIFGIIFGCLGLKSKDRRGLAIAGIIISSIKIVFAIAIVIIYVILILTLIKQGGFDQIYPYTGT